MKWNAWHEKGGDTAFGWYPEHENDSQLTFQHQRGWHINIDVMVRGRFDRRLALVTNRANDDSMRSVPYAREVSWRDGHLVMSEPEPFRRVRWITGG